MLKHQAVTRVDAQQPTQDLPQRRHLPLLKASPRQPGDLVVHRALESLQNIVAASTATVTCIAAVTTTTACTAPAGTAAASATAAETVRSSRGGGGR